MSEDILRRTAEKNNQRTGELAPFRYSFLRGTAQAVRYTFNYLRLTPCTAGDQ